MNNLYVSNQYENKLIETVIWPFYRYSVLIPEQLGGDIFVWLYLSLIIFTNQNNKVNELSYTNEAKLEVQKMMLDNFSSVIDNQILTKIIYNAEKDYVVTSGKEHYLKEDIMSFINTYENLFSDKLEIKYVYQDGITGEILPNFGDINDLDDCKEDPISINYIKQPHSLKIKNAYEQYIKIKNNNYDEIIEEELNSNDEFSYEEETYLDSDEDEFDSEEVVEEKEKKNLNNYNVIFLKNQQCKFKLKVKFFIENNQIVAKSPFVSKVNTDFWMQRVVKKACNMDNNVKKLIADLTNSYVLRENYKKFEPNNKEGFAETLKHAKVLYRLYDALDDNTLRDYVIDLDKYFSAKKTDLIYFYSGKILERIVKKTKFTPTDKNKRYNYTYDIYCKEIDAVFGFRNYHKQLLKNPNLFNNWKSDDNSMKANLIDLFLNTDLVKSKLMYEDFIKDVFDIFSKRNTADHDNDEYIIFEKELIDKLIKISKVLFQYI